MLATIKRWVQSTIGVSSREANAFLIMLPAMFFIIFSQPLYRWIFVGNEPISVNETVLLDSTLAQAQPKIKVKDDSVVLFSFNPNTATVDQLKSLGIPQAVAKRIEQYRLKGGTFRIKKDFAKMYGLDSTLFISLTPFIDLPDAIIKEETRLAEKTPVRVIEYDLNKADTSDFKSVKGIGPVLASRILKYRESLGGFIQNSQLKEVYGLDSLVIKELNKFLVMDGFVPKKLNINQLTESELDKHPYLSFKQAKAIITYRMQHGRFGSVDDLRKVKLLNEPSIQKLAPYLSFE